MNDKDKEALKNEVKQTSHGISVTKYNKELVRREFEQLQAENAKLRKLIHKSIQGFGFARMVLREACFHAAADDMTDYIDVVSSSLKELEDK